MTGDKMGEQDSAIAKRIANIAGTLVGTAIVALAVVVYDSGRTDSAHDQRLRQIESVLAGRLSAGGVLTPRDRKHSEGEVLNLYSKIEQLVKQFQNCRERQIMLEAKIEYLQRQEKQR